MQQMKSKKRKALTGLKLYRAYGNEFLEKLSHLRTLLCAAKVAVVYYKTIGSYCSFKEN